MLQESGDKDSAIWLLGDSSPLGWGEFLSEPLDSRHPARHNIWTPVLERIQELAFSEDRRRLDGTRLYVRNAVHNPEDRPRPNALEWDPKLIDQTSEFGKLLKTHAPQLVFTFGAFAFEFARRGFNVEPGRRFSHWTTARLGAAFRQGIEDFNPETVNILPLLHVSIARGHFLKSHENFTEDRNGNYFDFVGKEIGALLLEHKCTLNIWVGP